MLGSDSAISAFFCVATGYEEMNDEEAARPFWILGIQTHAIFFGSEDGIDAFVGVHGLMKEYFQTEEGRKERAAWW